MYYSTPRGGEHGNQARDHNQKTDWMCSKVSWEKDSAKRDVPFGIPESKLIPNGTAPLSESNNFRKIPASICGG
jgi:hypothetical protein